MKVKQTTKSLIFRFYFDGVYEILAFINFVPLFTPESVSTAGLLG